MGEVASRIQYSARGSAISRVFVGGRRGLFGWPKQGGAYDGKSEGGNHLEQGGGGYLHGKGQNSFKVETVGSSRHE